MPATITKPYRVKKSVFFAVLLLVLLTSVVSIYSAPDQQQDSPTTSESLPYLALEHYEMNPRAYMETLPADPDAPTAPTSPSYIPWSLVVYQSYRTNHWDIYLSDDEGSYETRLTTSGDDEIHPRLNRGGTRIAYAVDQGGDYEIYVMNRDGTNKTHLTNNSTDDVNPYWSPDGTQIVFQAYRDGQPEIYVMNADGSGQTRLTNSGDYDGMPAWSPDGAKIAFASRRTGGYRIYTMNPDGSSQIQLSNQPYSLEPAWSPDSSRIAYSSDGDNNTWFEIWTMNADGSSQTLKYSLAGEQDTLTRSWSPNGSYIAYTKVNYIYYQGTWYWTDSYLEAVNFGILGPNTFPNRNWYPDWQTLDNQKPTSQVTALTPISPAVFTVTWGGSDAGGSGLKNYDVQVRDGANGAWTAWKTGTTQTSASYTGIGGHTYYFRSRGRDNSFNVEAWPTTADAVTTVESSPPQVFMTTLPAYSHQPGITVRWMGTDPGGSGITSYDVQYRAGTNGSWMNLVTNTTQTRASFTGTAGTTYYFQVRAHDKAQNVSAWPGGHGHTFTSLYTWAIRGIATNNAGTPIMGLTTVTSPGAFASLPANTTGHYGTYVATSASTYTVDWSKTGYGDLPLTSFNGSAEVMQNIVLPPADNVIQNGHFEVAGFANWQPNGSLPITQTQNAYHTGTNAAAMGEPATLTPPNLLFSHGFQPVIDTDGHGVVHATWNSSDNARIYYSQRTDYAPWSTPLALSPSDEAVQKLEMIATDSGQVHVFWIANEANGTRTLNYTRRNSNGTWTTPLNISSNHNPTHFTTYIDADGRGHAIYGYSAFATLYYVRQNSNDTWTTPEVVTQNVSFLQLMPMVKTTAGYVHIFWVDYGNALMYTRRGLAGNWSTPVPINASGTDGWLWAITTDMQGDVHLLRGDFTGTINTLYYQKIMGTSWSDPEIITDSHIKGTIILDDEGHIHLVWGESHNLYYMERTEDGWSTAELVHTSATQYPGVPEMVRSESGTLYLTWYESDWSSPATVFFSQRPRHGNWEPATMLASVVGFVETDANITVDQNDVPHLLWYDQTGVYDTSQPLATQAGNATLQQTVTIPISQTVPTLSFLYRLDGTTSVGGSNFTVKATQGSSSTTLLTEYVDTSGWQHVSVDMTAYAGQTITLTFGLEQVANKPIANVYLDEVTLGSTQADVWVEGDYQMALPGETVTYVITYGNRGAAAANGVTLNHTLASGLTFVSATVAPTQINGSTLTWNLGELSGSTGATTIFVTVQVNAAAPGLTTLSSPLVIVTPSHELETGNNQAMARIYLAQLTYLPLIIR